MSDDLTIPQGAEIVLPPHGFIHLQERMASDLDVVNAARVSFAKESEWEHVNAADVASDGPPPLAVRDHHTKSWRKLKDSDEFVLRFLMKNKHGTPFEQNFFKFHVRAPIFVFREWHRHRIGISINEESARYSPLAGDFYIPEGDAWREQVGKPGRYTYETIDDLERIAKYADMMQGVYDHAYEVCTALMEDGLAKEIARSVLPVGIYSQMIWTCNARSLMAFLALRNDSKAQWEIRQYAASMESLFAQIMPVTANAFVAGGRVAP